MRKILTAAAALGIMAISVAGCAGGGDAQSTTDGAGTAAADLTTETLAGDWILVDGKGADGYVISPPDQPIELNILADGNFSGNSGCNQIMGTLTIAEGVIDFGPIGQTMMFCEDTMELEGAYTKALEAVRAGEVVGDTLVLTGEDTQLNYKRAEPLSTEALAGTWTLSNGAGVDGVMIMPTDEAPIDIVIEADGTFGGTSGCNNYSGALTITDGLIEVGPMALTQMACDETLMVTESSYTEALALVTGGRVSGDQLTLTGEGVQLNYLKSVTE
ncbi:META domain-containing protein [Actinomyces minihominis]|uniref:META domain-containing protein n=1 Tax=Actinomyces minihominis TaxID=2002838 RepID=UPI000C085A0C|nr:META domain-containing protein [Actinomyces minihominis]